MFKDIIIGQYIDTGSIIHRLDAAVKLVMTIAFAVVLFLTQSFLVYFIWVILLALITMLARVPIRLILKSMKPIIFLAIFTLVVNSFLVGGTEIFGFWKLHASYEGLKLGAMFALRLVILVWGAAILTLTTPPLAMTDGMERLMKPLEFIKIPTHDIAMMMTIAMRFIPTLGEEASIITDAQASRGADFSKGSVADKIRAVLPILVPLFISAIRHSDELATAMDARCWSGKRTKMKQAKITGLDIKAAIIFALTCITLIITEHLL